MITLHPELDDPKRGSLKFVAFEPLQVTLFPAYLQHSAIAEAIQITTTARFVGAGLVENSNVCWGSASCDDDFGYSSPPDIRQNVTILRQIQQAFNKLVE